MQKALIAFSFFLSVCAQAGDLPKQCFGQYAGEMQSYNVVKNEVELSVDKHDVKIIINENELIYSTGKMVVTGAYSFIKQADGEYLLVAEVSNGRSINFDLEMVLNKKDDTIYLSGKNGEPSVNLEKLVY